MLFGDPAVAYRQAEESLKELHRHMRNLERQVDAAAGIEKHPTSKRALNIAEQYQQVFDAQKALRDTTLLDDPDVVHDQYDQAAKNLKKLRQRLRALERQLDDVAGIDEKPIVEATTLWDFPTQSYGAARKGDSKFQGVTPAFIIYNMLQRYTEPGDLVLDPMCGSGTTIDVCREEEREVIGYDINPTRDDIIRNDARSIPLEDASVDMVFIDSPYSDNVDYNDEPGNIGNLSAEQDGFYDALRTVANELFRVLKPGKTLGWLIGDQWVKRRYTPVGMHIYRMLVDEVGFIPTEWVIVARRNQSSNTGLWAGRARRHNFYLRGHKHLILVRKPEHRAVRIAPERVIQVGIDQYTRDPQARDWKKYK